MYNAIIWMTMAVSVMLGGEYHHCNILVTLLD